MSETNITHPPPFTLPDDNLVKRNEYTGIDGKQYYFDFSEKKWKLSPTAYDSETISLIINELINKGMNVNGLVRMMIYNPYLFPGVYTTIKETNSFSKYSTIFSFTEVYLSLLSLLILDNYQKNVFRLIKVKIDPSKINDLKNTKLINELYVDVYDSLKININKIYKCQKVFTLENPYPSIVLFILAKLDLIDLKAILDGLIWRGRGTLTRITRLNRIQQNGTLTKIAIPDEVIINHVLPNLNPKEFLKFCSINKYYRKLLLESDNKLIINMIYRKFEFDPCFELAMNHHPEIITKYRLENKITTNGWRVIRLPGSLIAYLKDSETKLDFTDIIYLLNIYPEFFDLIKQKCDLREHEEPNRTIIVKYFSFMGNRL